VSMMRGLASSFGILSRIRSASGSGIACMGRRRKTRGVEGGELLDFQSGDATEERDRNQPGGRMYNAHLSLERILFRYRRFGGRG
jgi:hypothetical protein